jgi:hypothetical protein
VRELTTDTPPPNGTNRRPDVPAERAVVLLLTPHSPLLLCRRRRRPLPVTEHPRLAVRPDKPATSRGRRAHRIGNLPSSPAHASHFGSTSKATEPFETTPLSCLHPTKRGHATVIERMPRGAVGAYGKPDRSNSDHVTRGPAPARQARRQDQIAAEATSRPLTRWYQLLIERRRRSQCPAARALLPPVRRAFA